MTGDGRRPCGLCAERVGRVTRIGPMPRGTWARCNRRLGPLASREEGLVPSDVVAGERAGWAPFPLCHTGTSLAMVSSSSPRRCLRCALRAAPLLVETSRLCLPRRPVRPLNLLSPSHPLSSPCSPIISLSLSADRQADRCPHSTSPSRCKVSSTGERGFFFEGRKRGGGGKRRARRDGPPPSLTCCRRRQSRRLPSFPPVSPLLPSPHYRSPSFPPPRLGTA